jgi:hypothetical protein
VLDRRQLQGVLQYSFAFSRHGRLHLSAPASGFLCRLACGRRYVCEHNPV